MSDQDIITRQEEFWLHFINLALFLRSQASKDTLFAMLVLVRKLETSTIHNFIPCSYYERLIQHGFN